MTMIITPTDYTVISLDVQSNQNTTRYQVCVRANPSKPRCQRTKTLLCTSGAIFRSIKTSRATSLSGDSCSTTTRPGQNGYISRFPWSLIYPRVFYSIFSHVKNLFGMHLLVDRSHTYILFNVCPMSEV